jgi:hypothetical protein
MIAITTSSSMSVNPSRLGLLCGGTEGVDLMTCRIDSSPGVKPKIKTRSLRPAAAWVVHAVAVNV